MSSVVTAGIPPRSLLVVRLGAMGDVIHTLSAVSSLRVEFPKMRIGWIIESRWVELLCANSAPRFGERIPQRPVADFVHVVDTKRWRRSLFSSETKNKLDKLCAKCAISTMKLRQISREP